MGEVYMHRKADELFWWFEENKFVNTGIYPRKTNLIFAFADFVDKLSDDDISDILSSTEYTVEFRKTLKEGVDNWLEQNSKTMTII